MCFQQAVIIFLAAAISLCTATAIKCDADLTTKFAIGKRQMEKQLECRMDKENIAKCDDGNEVNKAWQTFEEINDQYSKAISDCKITQRLKRRRTIDCGCTQRKEEVGYERVKRSCGCGQDRHHGSAGVNHHRHATEETEDAMNEAEEMMAVSSHRMRRHRHRNAPELQKHERGKHGRAHVPHRHGHKSAAKKHGAHRRRHDHGSNDDPKEKVV
ncbi:hypothetical protein Tcan_17568 [Toxocara canis]|uniref:Uncharacterized protein n=1 Tax=Toxocara canis TaxID=6265 RepID=A0A0B2UTN3_TOXCA|nr:hypothetical protein Tcan_17568 [Toxocara canis]